MPELPEVDMMVDVIRAGMGSCRNWQIHDVSVIRNNGKYLPGDELDKVRGVAITDVYRRGKFLLFWMSDGILVCHNAMSGYWDYQDQPWTFDYVEGKRKATESDVRVTMTITPSGMDKPSDRILRFHDARLFGSLRFYDTREIDKIPSLRNLGPDCIRTKNSLEDKPILDLDYFSTKTKEFKKTAKEFLMNQEIIAGLGNIYSSESLFRANIDPRRNTKTLSGGETLRLFKESYFTLWTAVKGKCNYSNLEVYRKNKCSKCDSKIQMEKIAGRSTYFCPNCQR